MAMMNGNHSIMRVFAKNESNKLGAIGNNPQAAVL